LSSLFPFIDSSKIPPKPQLFLCRPNKQVIGKLKHACKISMPPKFGNIYDLTFTLPKQIWSKDNYITYKYYNLIKVNYLIKVDFIWGTDYFVVDQLTLENKDDWSVHCQLSPYQLISKKFNSYKSMNDQGEEAPIDIQQALTDALSKNYAWNVGHIDDSLLNIYRTFEVDGQTALDFVLNIADTFNAIVTWDTVNNLVNMYNADTVSQNKGFRLSYRKYLKTLNKDIDNNNIVTRLHCTGKDGLTFNSISSNGVDYVENYDFFLAPFGRDENKSIIRHSDFMSDSLAMALLDYQELVMANANTFKDYLAQQATYQSQLSIFKTELFNLNTDLAIIQDNIAVNIDPNAIDDLAQQLMDKQEEISVKETEINQCQSLLDEIQSHITDLKNLISIESNFTQEQLGEWDYFIYEDDFSDDNYLTAEDLLDAGGKELVKKQVPTTTFDIDIVDFLSIVECQKDWNRLSLGDIVTIDYDLGKVQAKIIEIDFDFESGTIKLQISDEKEILDNTQKFFNDHQKSVQTSSTVDIKQPSWDTSVINSNTAVFKLDDLSSDNKLTPSEKLIVKKEWNSIINEEPTVIKQALTYEIEQEKDDFIGAFNDLNDYITPILSDILSTTDINGVVFRLKFKNYYYRRTILQKTISDVAKQLADTAKLIGVTAMAAANGTNTIFTGANTPTANAIGDQWYKDNGDGTTILMVWDGTKWFSPTEQAVAGAEFTLSAMNQNYYQADAPTNGNFKIGDMWYKPDGNGNFIISKWNGAYWEGIDNAGDIVAGNISGVNFRGNNLNLSGAMNVTGSISAANMGVIIDGNGISIAKGSLNLPNTQIDAYGNLTTINANVTGAIHATSGTFTGIISAAGLNLTGGTFGGTSIVGGSYYQNSNGQNIWIDANGFHEAYNGLDIWISKEHGFEIIKNGASKFHADTDGNLYLTGTIDATNGNLYNLGIQGILALPKTYNENGDSKGMRGWYEFNEDWNAYNAKNLNGWWRLNSSYLSYESRVHIQESGTEYWSATYIGASAIKLRAYNNSSNGSFDGDFSDLRDRVDISPHQITMGQTGNLTSPDWNDTIRITADGNINANTATLAGNIRFQTPHVINSQDGGDLYFEKGNGSGNDQIDIYAHGFHGTLYGSVDSGSLESLKTNIKPIEIDALGEINNTNFYAFNYKKDIKDGITKPRYGLIIGDDYKYTKSVTDQNNEGVIDYSFITLVAQAVKQLSSKIDMIESKLNNK
jgi:hypothetical protein